MTTMTAAPLTAPVSAPTGAPAAADLRDPITRLEALFDPDTVRLLNPPDSGGVTAAQGRVEGTAVVAYATDPRQRGGALDVEGCSRIVSAIRFAAAENAPVVGIWQSGGAHLAEGVRSLDAVGSVFAAMVRASGRIPQISVILGAAAGGAAYGPALGDLVVMSDSARVFVTGPDVVRAVTGEAVDAKELGGPDVHARRSGLAHRIAGSDAEAIAEARTLAGLLGRPGQFRPDHAGTAVDPSAKLPDNPRRAYDVRPILSMLLDEPGVELQAKWAPNIVTLLGRLTGRTVGVIANNPLRLGGCLNAESAEKAARFVRTCDSLGVPLVVVVDVPGYLPGVGQEWSGVVRRGAKLLHAFAESVVPRVTLVTRKAYGGAYIAMNSRSLGASAVFAWPQTEVAVMAAPAAVDILHRRTLANTPAAERQSVRARLVDEHTRTVGSPNLAVEIGAIDEVIHAAETRRRISEALDQTPRDTGRHTNIPL